MSVFGKLFGAGGGRGSKGGPTPQEAIQRLRDTEEMLSKKQEFLEKKIEQELTAAKKHGTKNKRVISPVFCQSACLKAGLCTVEWRRVSVYILPIPIGRQAQQLPYDKRMNAYSQNRMLSHEWKRVVARRGVDGMAGVPLYFQSLELGIAKGLGAALQALKRKKRYEKQLAQIDGTLSTIEFQREALENANTNTEVLKNMGYAAKAMKTAHDNMDIDKVDELMQDIADQQELAEEISTAISKPVGFGEEFDEDELLKELEILEQEELDKNLLDISGPETVPLPNVPSVALPSKPVKKKEEEDDDMKELENWAGSM
ncbi:hypothetical protein ACRRTK_013414 [Alexandromys fortis]